MRIRHLALAFACLTLLVAPWSAMAETIFEAQLNSDQQIPLSASNAFGSARLVLNEAQTEVVFHVELHNLEGGEIRAQIHNGAPGENGPTLFFLPLGNLKDGVWPVSEFEATELSEGRIYIDIHSSVYPHGEIRGDVGPAPTPVEQSNWSAFKALY